MFHITGDASLNKKDNHSKIMLFAYIILWFKI